MTFTNKKTLFVTLIVVVILAILYFNKSGISQNQVSDHSTSKDRSNQNRKSSPYNDKTQNKHAKRITSQDKAHNNDEDEIAKKITSAIEEHKKLQGKNTKAPKFEQEGKAQQREINAKILENLIGLESTFFIYDRAVDMSIISGMADDSLFNEFLDDFENNALNNPEVVDTKNAYLNSFYGALESLESPQIHINEFQCGLASCMGSFNSFNNSDWNNFISARRKIFNEDFPLNTYVDYPQIIDDGSTVHRIFFSINGNIDSFYQSNPTQPPPISGGV